MRISVLTLSLISFVFSAAGYCESESSSLSRDYRANSLITLAATPIGFYPYPGGGVHAGLVLGPKIIVEAAYASAKSNWAGVSKYIHSMVDARVRFFPSNAFSLLMGIGTRRIRINYEAGGFLEEEHPGVTSTVSSVGLRFALGNQWQFGRFVLGCDWAGLYVPLTKIGEENLDGDRDLTDEEREEALDDARDANNEGSAHFLQLHLGVSF